MGRGRGGGGSYVGFFFGGWVGGWGRGEFVVGEGGGDVGAEVVRARKPGVGAQDEAVAGEQKGGGDGADGGGAAKGGDDGGIGLPNGEGGVEGDGFGGELVVGAVIHHRAEHGEAVAGEIVLQGVPVRDGLGDACAIGAQEDDELHLLGVVGGGDGSGKFREQVLHLEIIHGWNRRGCFNGRGFASASGEQKRGA